MPTLGSPWQRFKARWQECSLCSLCNTRKNIVLCRGCIPCEVLFVGEAPGQAEDVLGKPFCGPAGHLLDQQIEEALRNADKDLRICFTNLVCCIPKDGNRKTGEPDKECIKACEPRLEEFIDLCSPKLVVLVGDLAKKHVVEVPWSVAITHPAAILRAEVVRQSLMHQKVIVVLENAFGEL